MSRKSRSVNNPPSIEVSSEIFQSKTHQENVNTTEPSQIDQRGGESLHESSQISFQTKLSTSLSAENPSSIEISREIFQSKTHQENNPENTTEPNQIDLADVESVDKSSQISLQKKSSTSLSAKNPSSIEVSSEIFQSKTHQEPSQIDQGDVESVDESSQISLEKKSSTSLSAKNPPSEISSEIFRSKTHQENNPVNTTDPSKIDQRDGESVDESSSQIQKLSTFETVQDGQSQSGRSIQLSSVISIKKPSILSYGRQKSSDIGNSVAILPEIENQKSSGTNVERISNVTFSGVHIHDDHDIETRFEEHPMDLLTDEQVIEYINDKELESKRLDLENTLLLNFLKENDRSFEDNLDQLMQRVGSCYNMDRKSFRSCSIGDPLSSLISIAEGRGPTIRASVKSDMVTRAMENIQTRLEQFKKSSRVTLRNVKNQLAEFEIRKNNIRDTMSSFENNVVVRGIHPLTKRIPAEKWLRFMDDLWKTTGVQIQKLRLRTTSLKCQLSRVQTQLASKEELRKNVHSVDFDQLQIQNKHLKKKLEQKGQHLIEMKKMHSNAQLILIKHRNRLANQQKQADNCKVQIAIYDKKIAELINDTTYITNDLEKEYKKNEYIKAQTVSHSVPDVIDYVRIKEKLDRLQKEKIIWKRRLHLQDVACDSALRVLKAHTGDKTVNPLWFETPDTSIASSDS